MFNSSLHLFTNVGQVYVWFQATRSTAVRVVQCQEDDDFMAAFDKMISETLQVSDHSART